MSQKTEWENARKRESFIRETVLASLDKPKPEQLRILRRLQAMGYTDAEIQAVVHKEIAKTMQHVEDLQTRIEGIQNGG